MEAATHGYTRVNQRRILTKAAALQPQQF